MCVGWCVCVWARVCVYVSVCVHVCCLISQITFVVVSLSLKKVDGCVWGGVCVCGRVFVCM